MTIEEKLNTVRVLTGESDEELLSTYLTIARDKILNHLYPFGCEDGEYLPERYDSIHCEATAYLIQKIGAEGQSRHSENGVDRTYDSGDLPKEIIRRITPRGCVL